MTKNNEIGEWERNRTGKKFDNPFSNKSLRKSAYTSAYFALEIGSGAELSNVGFVRSVQGGGIKTETLTHEVGGRDFEQRSTKLLGRPTYDDFQLQVGMSMAPKFYEWIESFFAGSPARKDGAVVAADRAGRERARRNFTGAVISKIDFPKMDADSHEPCYMTVHFSAEKVDFTPGHQKDNGRPEKIDRRIGDTRDALAWTPSNFELVLDGLSEGHEGRSVLRVKDVESFSIEQEVLDYQVGGATASVFRVPGRMKFPNISFSLPEVDADKLYDHFRKTASGQAGPKKTSGELIFTSRRGKALGRVELLDFDVANITPDQHDASSKNVRMCKVELAVDRMKFHFNEGRGGDQGKLKVDEDGIGRGRAEKNYGHMGGKTPKDPDGRSLGGKVGSRAAGAAATSLIRKGIGG